MSYVGADPIPPNKGGTGVINSKANTLTLAGTLATVGAFSSEFTMTADTNVTFPTSGTLAVEGGAITTVGDVTSGTSAFNGVGTTLTSAQSGFVLQVSTNTALAGGTISMHGGDTSVDTNNGGLVLLNGGSGKTTGSGGDVWLLAGTPGSTGKGGDCLITAHVGGTTSGDGGNITLTSGTATSGTDGVISANSGLTVDTSGRMYNTLQPCFSAYQPSSDLNVTGDGTEYFLGDTDIGTSLTELLDQTSSFTPGASGGALYTAPITGNYQFNYTLFINGMTAGTSTYTLSIITTTNSFILGSITANGVDESAQFSIICPMSATDTCKFSVTVSGGTKVVDVYGSASPFKTVVSGYLIC